MTSEFLHPDPGPDTFTVPVVVDVPDEDAHERALPETVELHIVEDAAVRFTRHVELILAAIDEVDPYTDDPSLGKREVRITDHLYEVMPPIVARHLLAYMHDLGMVQRRAKRGLGTFWQRTGQ